MRRWIVALLCITLPSLLQAEETYRTLGPDGTVEFSDTPGEGSAPIDIPTPPTYNPADYAVPRAPVTPGGDDGQGPDSYAGFAITAPVTDSNFISGNGEVAVSVHIPTVGDETLVVVIRLDGREVARGPGPSFTLSNVDRGSHELTAQLLDETGSVLATSKPTTFHLQRPSRLHHQPEK